MGDAGRLYALLAVVLPFGLASGLSLAIQLASALRRRMTCRQHGADPLERRQPSFEVRSRLLP